MNMPALQTIAQNLFITFAIGVLASQFLANHLRTVKVQT
jgi:hypothetical protein